MTDHSHSQHHSEAAHQDAHAHDDAHAEILAETTTIMGRTLPFPLYTVIFGVLGILTLFEIIIAEVFTSWVKVVALLAIAIAKSALVVIYYMHLKTDSKIFTAVLLVPVFIVTVSLLFLTITPYGAAY
ncbi:MAG: cytochrome C oxidase subunit IV family protein [Anaerolineae bacterium]|jgi:caa(3)-type oxidase subunit IV|nr:cytochrome C oxidase subunit IV family protein [Anaerolineae bacterium]